jgi:hypothetical protein
MIINGDFFKDSEIESFTLKNSKESVLTTKNGRQWRIPCSEQKSRKTSMEIEAAIMGRKE